MNIIVTGGAGFIGSNLVDKLLMLNHCVTCVDNFDNFYSRSIKENNILDQINNPKYCLIEGDIRNKKGVLNKLTGTYDLIVHIAAKAGINPSIINPDEYYSVNVLGTHSVFEIARCLKIKKVVFASSSSVYGANQNLPWKESDFNLLPLNPYAATKIASEAEARVYSHLFDIKIIALRLFTVYGPRQRPDLAIHKFFNQINENIPITLNGNGTSARDYTYISDIVDGFINAIDYSQIDKFEIFNLGNSLPIKLIDLINNIRNITGKEIEIKYKEMPKSEMDLTYADISKAVKKLNYTPKVSLIDGLTSFHSWQN